MTDYPMLAMGPEPFRFLPSGDPLQGTAFSWPFKLLAAIIVLGGALWLADLWLAGKLGASSRQGGGWLALGLLLMAWTLWHILTSQTRLAAGELQQSWILNKRMPLAEVIDMSINEMLTRTIITSMTALLALVALAVFGGPSLYGLSVIMLFGIAIGTYSSIYIAAPVILLWGVKRADEEAEPLQPAAAR